MFNTVCNDCEGCTRGVYPSSDQNAYISKVFLADNHYTAVLTIKFFGLYYISKMNKRISDEEKHTR